MENENLWAPWRIRYIKGLTHEPPPIGGPSKPACFLCEAAELPADSQEGRQRFMLLNDERGLIMLNRYPYTNGHLLVAPHGHVGHLGELTAEQRAGLIELSALAERALLLAFDAQGINLGINIGRCAGAGLPGHLHLHAVPRWNGDTNFMDVVGQVRVIPQALEESHALLSQTLQKLQQAGETPDRAPASGSAQAPEATSAPNPGGRAPESEAGES
jgi:ATP adenylyltransferase